MNTKHLLAALAAFVALSAHAQVAVKDAWIRGIVPGQKATGAFMRLASPAETSLVAVATPVARIAEIHTMSMDKGVMRMRAIDALPLPAGKAVALEPGGYHLMLMDLRQPLADGATIPLTLTFADAAGKRTTQTVNAIVRPLTAGAMPKH